MIGDTKYSLMLFAQNLEKTFADGSKIVKLANYYYFSREDVHIYLPARHGQVEAEAAVLIEASNHSENTGPRRKKLYTCT